MPKDKLTDYSATNASNTDVGGVNIDEGMLPSAVNNSIRELMTHLKNFSDGTDAIDALTVTGDLTVDTNTLHVDATNNRVGVGVSSPQNPLHVKGTSSGQNVLHLDNSAGSGVNGDTNINVRSTSLNNTTWANLVFAQHQLRVQPQGGSETVRVDSDGLKFNGDTAAANALDDYETGTYEPVITPDSGSVTINSSHTKGSYVKIGDMVRVQGHIVIASDSSATGRLLMTIPFNTADLDKTSARGAGSIVVTGTAENVNTFAVFYGENSSQLDIRRSNGTGISSTVGEALNGNDDIYFQATYRAS